MKKEMFGLSPNEIRMINGVFEKFPQVHEVVIYGSRAKGNFKPYSDIDLSLTGQHLSQKLLFEIELSLDDLMLPYIFDLNLKRQITNPEFINHIDRVGKLFYKKI